MEDSPETQTMGSGATDESGIAYDSDRLGEPGQPGVPTGDQSPTNEGGSGMNDAIIADVNIPGPYPSAHGDPTGEPLSPGPEPTKDTRDAGSLGDLTKEVSTSTVREQTEGLRSPMFDDEQRKDK